MLYFSDKAGDVYSFPLDATNEKVSVDKDEDGYIPDEEPGPEPILGHYSMLLDMVGWNQKFYWIGIIIKRKYFYVERLINFISENISWWKMDCYMW